MALNWWYSSVEEQTLTWENSTDLTQSRILSYSNCRLKHPSCKIRIALTQTKTTKRLIDEIPWINTFKYRQNGQQAFIEEKNSIYLDQHLFAWKSKKHFIFASRKNNPQAVQLEKGINFTAILKKMFKFFKHVKKIIVIM